jgi:hypothetical protein
MTVANMTFMVDRLSADCAPLQFVRELTQNSIAAVKTLPDSTGEIVWDVDWVRHTLTGTYKLSVIDTGIGMTGDEMVEYINKLSSSIHRQSKTGNFGVGAKIAATPLNKAGLVYLSWKDSVGYMIHLWKDPDTGVYGLRQIEWPDGRSHWWAYVEDAVKPSQIKEHGTMVVLLGDDVDANTMQPPVGTPMPSSWIMRYLNTRYYRFPAGVTVKAREGWELPKGNDYNFLRVVTGQKPWLDDNSQSAGTVSLTGARLHWWILKPSDGHGRFAGAGHAAALYQDELYEMTTGRAGVARLQSFGIIFGYNRVVLYIEPENGASATLVPNTSRTQLLMDGEPLPWADWAAEVRDNLPTEIAALVAEVGSGSQSTDHRQAIRERLKQIRDLFRISRYRPSRDGQAELDEAANTIGGKPKRGDTERPGRGGGAGGRGGRAGDVYSLFLKAGGTPGEEFFSDREPDVRWVSAADGTRVPPDLEDRAAKYEPHVNALLINADFRVFTDMIDRWCERYAHVSAARAVVEQIVREWFEQQLVEAVLGTLSLRRSSQWTIDELERLWSEETLTAVVLPRWHVEMNVKRALGAKLGTLKDRVA